ncbi:MAG: site-2 protease family protein [Planctomycetota bacterium]|jgi:Zn-dependent protease
MTILDLFNFLVVLILSTALHEMAHAYLADRFGDDTPREAGRLTWNPFPHLDPFMSIIVPGALYWMSDGNAFIAAAATPINPFRMRKPRMHGMLTALGGPAMNLLIMAIATVLLGVTLAFGTDLAPKDVAKWFDLSDRSLVAGFMRPDFRAEYTGPYLCFLFLRLNAFLGVFNMVPIPPLDGGNLIQGVLPKRLQPAFWNFRRYSFMILVALWILGGLDPVFEAMDWAAAWGIRGGVKLSGVLVG